MKEGESSLFLHSLCNLCRILSNFVLFPVVSAVLCIGEVDFHGGFLHDGEHGAECAGVEGKL